MTTPTANGSSRDRVRWRVTAVCGLIAAAMAMVATAADVQGSHDHPLITRFPGSTIIGYEQRDWDQTFFPLSAEMDASENTRFKSAATVEGKLTRIVYLAPVGKSTLEVFRNYQQALQAAGLKQRFACEGNCGLMSLHWRFGEVRGALTWTEDGIHAASDPSQSWNAQDAISDAEGRALYGTLAQGGRELHVMLYTSVAGYRETNASATYLEIAEPKAMPSGQVAVDANAMLASLTSDGKVALYGLPFDTGKSLIKPESKPQLEQMAKLLREHPTLAVFIVGHTDNQGSFESNLLLSKQRADAVRDALAGQYQIAAARMTAQGLANLAPVASNADDAGRARNRRVELVQR